ncbi:DNA cytosine methyltransferase [Pseudomonas aeruginosa]
MENVQGILWTPRDESDNDLSVAAHVLERLGGMGYLVFPKLLDAVWYGAPQNRNRFFLLGIHKDVGYSPEEFGKWGPFPKPTHGPGTDNAFVTVRDAISDLPELGNGDALAERPYNENIGRLQQNTFLQTMRAGAPRRNYLGSRYLATRRICYRTVQRHRSRAKLAGGSRPND